MTQPARMATAGSARAGEFPATLRLVLLQIRYQLLTFQRTPIALFFTLVFPLMFLLIIISVYGSGEIETGDGVSWTVAQFYVGGISAFTAVGATYTNLANMVPIRRDAGVMKRWRGTPLPAGVYIAGFIGAALLLATIGTVVMIAVGVIGYDVEVDTAKIPAAVLVFAVGVSAWSALGLAIAGLVPTASSSAMTATATLMPLAFISDVFIQSDDGLGVLSDVASLFPLKPFANGMQDVFNPFVEAPAIDWAGIATMAAWGVIGVFVAIRFFRWEPHVGGTRRRRRGQGVSG